jgi:hypothetical protein
VVEQSIAFDYDTIGLLVEEDVTMGATAVTCFGYDGWNPAKAGATGTGFDGGRTSLFLKSPFFPSSSRWVY